MEKKSSFVVKFAQAYHDDLLFLDDTTSGLINLHRLRLNIPGGFIITSAAYILFIKENKLQKKINDLLSTVHYTRTDSLMQVATHIKKLILDAKIPSDLVYEINAEYRELGSIFSRASVTVGIDKKKVRNVDDVLDRLKEIWALKFDAKNLLFNYKHNKDNFEDGIAIAIKQKIDTKKSGSIHTANYTGETGAELSRDEFDQIKDLGEQIRAHVFLPKVATWAIVKNKIYITDIKPETNTQKTNLVLVRHGESEWNAKDLWTGLSDIPLSAKGHVQAKDTGTKLKDIHFDVAFTSALLRSAQTLAEIKKAKGQSKVPTISNKSLDERNYGDLTGKNKIDIEKEVGKEQFLLWRRSWDSPLPHGETLKDVYERVIPYYIDHILPKLKAGKNVIVVAHGNSLRALVKYLDNISDEDIPKLEIPVGEMIVYKINEDGKMVSKEIRNEHAL